MADLDPCTLLRQADQAWFDIATGAGVRRVRDQNGEEVEYAMANRTSLLAMMQSLQAQCPTYTSVALGANWPPRPVKFLF